jgi:hypothetical protein
MWMANEPGYKNTYMYEQIQSHGLSGHTEADGLSTAVRFLIHYTGDIHQPLHATARVNHEYPAGDRGGNSFPLPSIDGAKNLHSVWDSVLYSEPQDFTTPFSDADWDKVGNIAKSLVAKYPPTGDVDSLDPLVWAKDSYTIASTFLYKNIKESTPLTSSYVDDGAALAESQIVKGGNRLANLMIEVFS